MGVQHAKGRSFDKHLTSASVAAGDVKGGQGRVPPAQKAVTARRGTNHGVFVPLLEVKQTGLQVPLCNAFPLVEQMEALLLEISFRPAPRRGALTVRLPSCCITHEGSSPVLHDLTQHFPPSQFFLHTIPAVTNSSH